ASRPAGTETISVRRLAIALEPECAQAGVAAVNTRMTAATADAAAVRLTTGSGRDGLDPRDRTCGLQHPLGQRGEDQRDHAPEDDLGREGVDPERGEQVGWEAV